MIIIGKDKGLKTKKKSNREVVCHISDKLGYSISENCVYKRLESYNLESSPANTVVSAKDQFGNPTKNKQKISKNQISWFIRRINDKKNNHFFNGKIKKSLLDFKINSRT